MKTGDILIELNNHISNLTIYHNLQSIQEYHNELKSIETRVRKLLEQIADDRGE